MAKWTPTQRRQELRRLFSNGRSVVARQLARQWGCDERTVRRLLKTMKTDGAIPIEYDRSAGSWRSTADIIEIDPILASAEDRRALLFSLQFCAQMEGSPLPRQTRRLYKALLDTLPPERATRFERMMASVRFTGPTLPAIRPDVWSVTLLCLEARETMRIRYTSGSDGQTADRDVDPYGLIMRDRHWLLIAFCHLRQDVLAFALHRIATADSADKTFAVPDGFLDRYLAGSFDGLPATGRDRKVVLRIKAGAPLFIRERIWAANETRRQLGNGNLLVTFSTTALFAVEREVRAEGGSVELLQPSESRHRLQQTAQEIAAAHLRPAHRGQP